MLIENLFQIFERYFFAFFGEGINYVLCCDSTSVINIESCENCIDSLIRQKLLRVDSGGYEFRIVYVTISGEINLLNNILDFLL
jgi:hypothetical protein